MAWRYQPVFVENGPHVFHGVCEVYFSDAGELEGWTDIVQPTGDTADELRECLTLMLKDAKKWTPVELSKLQQGFRFEQATGK